MPTRVLVDANVLYSKTLRDWLCLLYLASDTYFAVYWTEDILAETIAHLRDTHPKWRGGKITKIHDQIKATFEGGRVDDFVVDGSYPGTDLDDQHVHAAALECRAQILLTDDAGFLSAVDPATLPYEVHRPDSFFCLVDEGTPDLVLQVTRQQTDYWLKKRGEANLPKYLRRAGCNEFADRVRYYLRHL